MACTLYPSTSLYPSTLLYPCTGVEVFITELDIHTEFDMAISQSNEFAIFVDVSSEFIITVTVGERSNV